MKVYAINPGKIAIQNGEFYFTIAIEYASKAGRAKDTWEYTSTTYKSAPAAKQAMREEVARLRKRHGLNSTITE